MKAFFAFVAFALVLAVAAAALAPATLVDAQVARASDGALRIADARGTLWRGRGMLTTPEARWQLPLHWQLAPLALVQGTVQATLGDTDASAYDASGALEVDRSRVAVDALTARLPAAVANVAGPLAAIAGGEVTLRAPRLVATDRTFDGSVVAEWRNARLAVNGQPLLALGTVTTNLTGRGDALSGPVNARGGDVEVDGTLALRAGRASVDLRVKPHPDAAPAIRDALSRLGAPDASGAFALRFDQPLR
jgi:general secretion pathway protein N